MPTVEEATIRERSRAREAALRDLKAATCRLNALVRRHALRDTGRANGSPAHLRWRAEVGGPTPALPIVLQDSGHAVHERTERLQRFEQARPAQATAWRLRPVLEALEARRGVLCTVAVTPVVALGDLPRVDPPRQPMKG